MGGREIIRAFESNDRMVLESEIIHKLAAIRENRLETYEYALELQRTHGRY